MISNRIICVVPVFNDWDSFSMLVSDIQKQALINKDYQFSILAINDGSTERSLFLHKEEIIIE